MSDDKRDILTHLLDAMGVIPGGVLPTDHWHHGLNDRTCSRCRKPVAEDEVPVMLWAPRSENMLMYCKACLKPR